MIESFICYIMFADTDPNDTLKNSNPRVGSPGSLDDPMFEFDIILYYYPLLVTIVGVNKGR